MSAPQPPVPQNSKGANEPMHFLCKQNLLLRAIPPGGWGGSGPGTWPRLYLVTRNPNLNLPPDALALVSQVNFAITRSGLEGQLLGVTLQHTQASPRCGGVWIEAPHPASLRGKPRGQQPKSKSQERLTPFEFFR